MKIVISLILASLVLASVPPALAYQPGGMLRCSGFIDAGLPLNSGRRPSLTTPTCYRVNIPEFTSQLYLELQRDFNDVPYDIYVTYGDQGDLLPMDRSTVPANSGTTVELVAPVAQGTWTIAVVSPAARGNFFLVGKGPDSSQSGAAVFDEFTPPPRFNIYPVLLGNSIPSKVGDLNLNSRAGTQAIFPFFVGAPGKVYIRAEWKGAARDLRLSLHNSDLSAPQKKMVASSRNITTDPNVEKTLDLMYSITAEDIEKGESWWVKVVNSGGGSLSGRVLLYADPWYMFLNSVDASNPVVKRNFVNSGELHSFWFSLPQGCSQVTVSLLGPASTDFDLFTRYGRPVVRSQFDWKSDSSGSAEKTSIRSPLPGQYYVQAKSSQGKGAYTLEVNRQCSPIAMTGLLQQAKSITWRNRSGEKVTFNGARDDRRGWVQVTESVKMEDGQTYRSLLQTWPAWEQKGWIAGIFPLQVPKGGRFAAKVGLIDGAAGSDGVTFGVGFSDKADFQDLSKVESIGEIASRYDNRLDTFALDLSKWAGRKGYLVLYVNPRQSWAQDWAVWVNPRIVTP